MKKIFLTIFCISSYILLVGYNCENHLSFQLQEKDFLFSISEKDNIIIENYTLYSQKGKFAIYNRPSKLNEYTFDLVCENNSIGRYSDGNGDVRKMFCEIYTSNKHLRSKIGLRNLVSLKRIEKKIFEDEIKNALKSYPKDFFINPEILNNKGFFLYKYKYYKEALIYLNKTKELFPNRVVVYLNLGDCYWELNQKDEAKKAYEEYVSLMKSQKKDLKKIPKRVFDRKK